MEKVTTKKAISNAVASVRMEGYHITKEHINLAQKVLENKMTMDECLSVMNKQYIKGK